MIITKTKSLSKKRKHEIIALWNEEYPKKLMLSALVEFEEYLEALEDKHYIILSDENGKLRGWLVYFIRDNERWFAMILDSSVQGKGLGSKILTVAKKHNPELNGWVIDNDTEPKQNVENYKSPIGFYRKNGFEILLNSKLEKKGINGVKVKWKK